MYVYVSHIRGRTLTALTLFAFLWVTSTTCGDSPSLTVRVTNNFAGMICPPTCAAHPKPNTRLHRTSPFAESMPYNFPYGVAATMTFRNPNASRESGSEAFAGAATDALTVAYEPVTKRRTKLAAYCGKSCPDSISELASPGRYTLVQGRGTALGEGAAYLGIEKLTGDTRPKRFLLAVAMQRDLPFW